MDQVTYSVPIRHAYRSVWAKLYHDRVAIAVGAEFHVLPLLERKHRAVAEATALVDWQLDPVTDGSQSLDLQRDALGTAGVDAVNVYHDLASGVRDDRPGLDSCLRALRKDDVLVVWKLDRLGRNLAHLVNTVQDLAARGVGLRVLAGQGAQVAPDVVPTAGPGALLGWQVEVLAAAAGAGTFTPSPGDLVAGR